MHRIETDHKRKILRITVHSFLNVQEGKVVMARIVDEMRLLKGQGFSALVDFREAGVLPPEIADLWVEVGKQAREQGLKKSARLVTSALMKAQVNWVGREAHNSDVVRNFTDEAEALKWLAEQPETPSSK